MIVQELIEALQDVDPNSTVVVSDDEHVKISTDIEVWAAHQISADLVALRIAESRFRRNPRTGSLTTDAMRKGSPEIGS